MPEQSKFDPNFYKRPSNFALGLMVPFYGFTSVSLYFPDVVPDSTGALYSAVQYASSNYRTPMTFALWGIVIAHILEGFYTVKLCSDYGMTTSAKLKWFISSCYCGAFSFQSQLKPYLNKFKKD